MLIAIFTIETGVLVACDFEYEDPPYCGFTQSYEDDFDWIRYYGATPSADTGPDYDHTSGDGNTMILSQPSLISFVIKVVSFYYKEHTQISKCKNILTSHCHFIIV